MNIYRDEVEVNIHAPMVPEPAANNCFSIIFRGEYQGLQKHKNTDAILRLHILLLLLLLRTTTTTTTTTAAAAAAAAAATRWQRRQA